MRTLFWAFVPPDGAEPDPLVLAEVSVAWVIWFDVPAVGALPWSREVTVFWMVWALIPDHTRTAPAASSASASPLSLAEDTHYPTDGNLLTSGSLATRSEERPVREERI